MSAKEDTWFTGERSHKGYPLLLRFPEERKYEETSKLYQVRISIEHTLKSVKDNGLPHPEYNDSLAELDDRIIQGLDCMVLVETFGGRRTYYAYSENKRKVEVLLESIKKSYPDEKFMFVAQHDPNWNFIKEYAEDYEFYRKKG